MNDYPRYFGNYLGIVIGTNDPEMRGRVQVFIPHMTPHVYKNWTESKKDRNFKFIGANVYSDLGDIVTELKQILPWAECAAPLVGENSSGRYNSQKNIGSISDSNKPESFCTTVSSCEINTNNLTEYAQNKDNIGEKLGNRYDIDKFKVNDAFSDPSITNCNSCNKFSYNYKPECYSNKAKGSFSIPNVGAHVWVFFNAGDPQKPVYFAAQFGKDDWAGLYDETDYPGTFENSSLSGISGRDLNNETYRNKYIINQKGGTIQIINTDNKETLKLTHFSGSFKEFSNLVTIEFAQNNDQKLVLGDSFSTVRGDRNEYTQGDYDYIVNGDNYIKVGNLKADYFAQWKQIFNEIADTKQLFDIQRADKLQKSIYYLTSTQQKKSGTPAPCPVCNGSQAYYWVLNSETGEVNTSIACSEGDVGYGLGAVTNLGPLVSPTYSVAGGGGKIFGETCPSCGGTGISKSSMDGKWNLDPFKMKIGNLIKSKLSKLTEVEKKMGVGGSQIIDITKNKFETIGMVMNDFGSVRVDAVGKMYNAEVVVGKEGVFENKIPSPLVEYVQVDDLPGGSYTLNVCNKYTVQVGAGGLIMKSFGPTNISGTIVNVAGEQVNIGSRNEVNVDGGTRLSLVADIVSIKQRDKKQVLVDSSLGVSRNVIVGGGLHVEGELYCNHITAPGEIQQTEQTVVYGQPAEDLTGAGVKTGTGVALLITEDGMFSYVGRTDPTQPIGYCIVNGSRVEVYGNGMPCILGSHIGYGGQNKTIMPIITYGTGADDDCIVMAGHSHLFKNIPLTLTKSNNDVRDSAKALNEIDRAPASPISNSKK